MDVAWGLDPNFRLHQYTLTTWQGKDGLTNPLLFSLAVDRQGYIWLGTAGAGLIRFDGSEFRRIELGTEDQHVRALLEDRKGRLWVGTTGSGIAVLDHGKILRITQKQGLPNDSIDCLVEEPATGAVWIGTRRGLAYWRDGKVTATYAEPQGLPDHIVKMGGGYGSDGHLWLGTERGVIRFVDGKFQTLTTADGLADNTVTSVNFDRSGNVWVGTNLGLSRWRGGRFETWLNREYEGTGRVWTLHEDRDGNIWFGGVLGQGLIRFRDGRFEHWEAGQDLAEAIVYRIEEDREGNLWLATNDGLRQLRDSRFRNFSREDGLPTAKVQATLPNSDGSVWLNSTGGAVIHFGPQGIQPQGIKTYGPRENIPAGNIQTWARLRDGSIVIACDDGWMRRFRAGSGRWEDFTIPGLEKPRTMTMLQAGDGALWIGTFGEGAYRWLDGVLTHYSKKNGLVYDQISDLAEGKDGTIWIGTSRGLHSWKAGTLHFLTAAEGFGTFVPEELSVDRLGVLWISSPYQIRRYANGKTDLFTAAQGLQNFRSDQKIVEDSLGFLWWFGSDGLYRTARSEFDAVAAGSKKAIESEVFNTRDGLGRDRGSGLPGAIAFGPDGTGWFATVKGVATLDPARIRRNSIVPPVVITRIAADGEELPIESARIPADARRVKVQFAALTYASPERVRFRYRLVGFDRSWIEAGEVRAAEYTNLPTGDFRFEVKAANADGVWNDVGAAVEVVRLPHFYQTTWFWVLSTVAAALAAFAFYRLRTQQLQYRYELVLQERTRVARELHDTILQSFSSLLMLLEASLRQPWGDVDRVRRSLREAADFSRRNLIEARHAVWDLRHEPQQKTLVQCLQACLEQARQTTSAQCELRVEGTVRALPADIEAGLSRAGQEAIANAARHAEANNILVTLSFAQSAIGLTVHDDGKGFFADLNGTAWTSHWGIVGIRERIELLKGSLDLSSGPGTGTRLSILVPATHTPSKLNAAAP